MKNLKLALVREFQYGFHALGNRWILLLSLFILLGITLAYQIRQFYVIDMGNLYDCPFLGKESYSNCPVISGWNDPETEPGRGITYRWTRSLSSFTIPGIGDHPLQVTLRVAGGRPNNDPPPIITVSINGQNYPWQTTADFSEKSFLVSQFSKLRGDLTVNIATPIFSTPSDKRKLGVRVDWVKIEQQSFDWSNFVVPSIRTTLCLFLALLFLHLISYRIYINLAKSIVITTIALFIIMYLIAFQRLAITIFASQFMSLMIWSWALFSLVIVFMQVKNPHGSAVNSQSQVILSFVFAAGLAIRFGGMIYPTFISSDLTFHAHRIEYVLRFFRGQETNFFFTGKLPDGTSVPYPSAYYVLLAPLEAVLGNNTEVGKLLLRFFSSLLDAGVIFLVYYIALPLGEVAALFAAFFYAVSPAPFQLLSAGNHSNIFAQTLLIAAIFIMREILGTEQRGVIFRRLGYVYLMTMTMAFLGHYGVALSAIVVIGTISLVWSCFSPRLIRFRIFYVIGWSAIAAFIAYGLYYIHFNKEIISQFNTLLSEHEQSGNGYSVSSLLKDIWIWQGSIILLTSLLGIALLIYRYSQASTLRSLTQTTTLVLAGWFIASIFLAITTLFQHDTVRFNQLLTPLLCICSGLTLQWIRLSPRRTIFGRNIHPGVIAIVCLSSAELVYTLSLWGTLVLTQYH